MLVDEFMPVYDMSGRRGNGRPRRHHSHVGRLDGRRPGQGGPQQAADWTPGALRMLPEIASDLLHGERPPAAPDRLRLRDLADAPWQNGGWTLLDERPGEEIALGLVGKFWRPVISYVGVSSAEFKAFSEPGYAKHVYSLGVRELDGGTTLLRGEMRVATTDAHARRWFRRYWTFGVGSGAHVLVNGVMESARDEAEAANENGSLPR